MKRILFSILLAFAGLSAAEKPYYWYYYTVDTTSIRGFSEIAFDAQGNLKIAYRRYYQVWYGELKDHQFKIQMADTGTGAAGKLALALDNDGHAHILYHDDVYQHVYLAGSDGSKWTHRTIDTLYSATVDFYHIDIAAGPDGSLHLAYTKHRPDADNSLYYRRIDPTGAMVDTGFVTAGLNGKWNSIALDAQNRPVIAFFRHSNELLQVAYPDSGRFGLQSVGLGDTLQPEGFYASLKHDTANTFYLAHQNRTERQLWLEHGVPGGTWTREVVDTGLGFTLFHSPSVLGLGKDNAPFISYASIVAPLEDSIVSCRLMLTRKVGGAWIKEVVDSAGIVGEYASLAVSPDGLPAISYYDRTHASIRVAVARTVAPTDTNNNGIPDYQELVSLVKRNGARGLKPAGKKSGVLFDSRGKAWRVKGSQAVPAQGRWYVPSANNP